ncbi:MAG: GldG family protein, partial [Rhodospirillales bacterium]|nr:GldG family protein [Rhodospirillales bacterium]
MSGPIDWLRRREGSRLAILALIVAAVLYVALNVATDLGLRGYQLDLTENRLYTLSSGTQQTLGQLDEPIELRLYFSKSLRDAVPQYAVYHARIEELLNRYAEIGKGNLVVRSLDPEPFSDAEDRAVADGLQGVPVTQAGDMGYFGLAGSNAIDGHETIGFFGLEREPFLEYDLTRLINGLANSNKPLVGIISALPPPPDGRPGSSRTPQALTVLSQLQQFFAVEELPPDIDAIPEGVDVLLVLHLGGVSGDAIREIDRFVRSGGPALVMVDPVPEAIPPHSPPLVETATAQDLERLLTSWGIKLLDGKVAGDLNAARRVSTGAGGAIADYLAWLALPRSAVDENDPVMASVERLNFATAGILEALPDETTTVSPL